MLSYRERCICTCFFFYIVYFQISNRLPSFLPVATGKERGTEKSCEFLIEKSVKDGLATLLRRYDLSPSWNQSSPSPSSTSSSVPMCRHTIRLRCGRKLRIKTAVITSSITGHFIVTRSSACFLRESTYWFTL